MSTSDEIAPAAPARAEGPPSRGASTGRPHPRYAGAKGRARAKVLTHELSLPAAAVHVAQPLPFDSEVLHAVALRERVYRWLLAAADGVAAAGSLFLVMSVIGGYELQPVFLIVVPLIVLVAKIQGLYDHDELVIHKSTLDELPRLVNLATLFALLTWLVHHYIVIGAPRTAYLLVLWLVLIVALAIARFAARAIARRAAPVERCLLVGGGVAHRRLAAKFPENGRAALVGAISVEAVAHDHGALHRAAVDHDAHRIIVAVNDHGDASEVLDVVRAVTASGLPVSLLPSALGVVGSAVVFDDIGGIPLLGVRRFGLTRSSRAIKRVFDIVVGAAVLVLCAPVLAFLALLVKLDSPGPALFRQTRVGRDDRHFRMLKLRTMIDGADAMKDSFRGLNEASGLFKIENDPRVTRVGRFLRATSLDELPQLINVLHGNMSLVGPRPLVPDEDERVTGYDRKRLHLTPGMTGRWQILGSARIPLSEMVKIDYLYVANWSLWADVKILLQTVTFVLGRRGL